MERTADYQEPAIDSFEQSEILGDAPETASTVAPGSVTEVHSA